MSYSTYTTVPNSSPSFYIPNLVYDYTEEDVKGIFRIMDIGHISRVDFYKKTQDSNLSAFVYMEYFYDTEIAYDVIAATKYRGDGNFYKLYLNDYTYLMILKNWNPVANSLLNTHQLTENQRLLEEEVNKCKQLMSVIKDKVCYLIKMNNSLQMELDDLAYQKNEESYKKIKVSDVEEGEFLGEEEIDSIS